MWSSLRKGEARTSLQMPGSNMDGKFKSGLVFVFMPQRSLYFRLELYPVVEDFIGLCVGGY